MPVFARKKPGHTHKRTQPLRTKRPTFSRLTRPTLPHRGPGSSRTGGPASLRKATIYLAAQKNRHPHKKHGHPHTGFGFRNPHKKTDLPEGKPVFTSV